MLCSLRFKIVTVEEMNHIAKVSHSLIMELQGQLCQSGLTVSHQSAKIHVVGSTCSGK